MELIPARRLLTPVSAAPEDFFLQNYNLNLYHGCSHGCIYCDSRSACYQLGRFDEVRAKENALALLQMELRAKKRPGVVSMGAMSDPYNPFEKELELTRGALRLFREYRFGAAYYTKSDLAKRDGDLMKEIGRHNGVRAVFSITCAGDEMSRRLEPGAPVSSKRFEAVASLRDKGIFTGVWINPVAPFLTDARENIISLLRLTKEAGGQFAVCFFGMTLRTGSREYFFQALDREFPGLKERYAKSFGNAYIIESPRAGELYQAFQKECARLGLMYRFSDINQAMMARIPAQLSFF